jgi:hypothetical protein
VQNGVGGIKQKELWSSRYQLSPGVEKIPYRYFVFFFRWRGIVTAPNYGTLHLRCRELPTCQCEQQNDRRFSSYLERCDGLTIVSFRSSHRGWDSEGSDLCCCPR